MIFDGTNLAVNGSITTTGTILASQFLPGQIIYTKILGRTDISQNTTTPVDSSSAVTISSYTYRPVLTNSKVIIEYCTTYTVAGNSVGGDDNLTSQIVANGGVVGGGYQQWSDAGTPTLTKGGVGTRSGTAFPIMGAYTNTGNATVAILIQAFRNVGGDIATITGDVRTLLKITEIVP